MPKFEFNGNGMEPYQDPEPVFGKINPVIVALAFVVGGLELLFLAGELGWLGGSGAIASRRYAIVDYGFWPQEFRAMLSTETFDLGVLVSFVSYLLIHPSFTYSMISVAFILGVGKALSMFFGPILLSLIFFSSGIFGAIVYGLTSYSEFPLAGSSPAVFGYVGSFGAMVLYGYERRKPISRRLLAIPVFLIGIPTIFNILLIDNDIWKADLAGFATGFIFTGFYLPGGMIRIFRVLLPTRDRDE